VRFGAVRCGLFCHLTCKRALCACKDSSRFAVYDKLFNLPPAALKTLLGPLDLQPGQTALDLGCGPGYVSAGIAQLVGPTGKVHGVDVNKPFCDRAVEVAKAQNLPNVTIHHVHDETLPLATSSLDRTVMKNVLEYVPSMDSTLSEVYRCTKPGGRILALDSDWSFLLVEPWSADEVREVFGGAAPAFREPNIGRKLRAGFRKAGFTEINVEIRANPDTGGQLRGVIGNMVGSRELRFVFLRHMSTLILALL